MKEFIKNLTPRQKKAVVLFVGASLGLAAAFYEPLQPVRDLVCGVIGC